MEVLESALQAAHRRKKPNMNPQADYRATKQVIYHELQQQGGAASKGKGKSGNYQGKGKVLSLS